MICMSALIADKNSRTYATDRILCRHAEKFRVLTPSLRQISVPYEDRYLPGLPCQFCIYVQVLIVHLNSRADSAQILCRSSRTSL